MVLSRPCQHVVHVVLLSTRFLRAPGASEDLFPSIEETNVRGDDGIITDRFD